jgi:hypothetical protein
MITLDSIRSPRKLVADWAEHGYIRQADLPAALRQTGIIPAPIAW